MVHWLKRRTCEFEYQIPSQTRKRALNKYIIIPADQKLWADPSNSTDLRSLCKELR